MVNITLEQIVDELDIKQGKPLMVSSDITKLWAEYRKTGRKFVPQDLIELLMRKVTEEGTLIFPTYSWDFCHGEGFDYYKTVPRTGGLGRIALTMEGFKRTPHPMYSFAVWGKDADMLCAMNNKSSFGKDSPFHYMREQKVDHLMIGIPFTKGYTFVHYVEEQVGVPYRYIKDFTDKYTDEHGNQSMRTYSMYVRALDTNLVYTDDIEELLADVIRQRMFHYGVEFRMINYAESYPVIEKDIVKNRSRKLAVYEGQ